MPTCADDNSGSKNHRDEAKTMRHVFDRPVSVAISRLSVFLPGLRLLKLH